MSERGRGHRKNAGRQLIVGLSYIHNRRPTRGTRCTTSCQSASAVLCVSSAFCWREPAERDFALHQVAIAHCFFNTPFPSTFCLQYSVLSSVIIMGICKAPTLRLKALNTHTHNVRRDGNVIGNKNVDKKQEKANT